jgi:small-conductance mechanosensitive channel
LRIEIIEAVFGLTVSAASIGISLVIILDCIMTFFGSSANDAAFNAWLTDSTNDGNRGAAEGINSMMPLMAILVVFGGFMFFNLDLSQSWVIIFAIVGGVVAVSGIVGFFIIDRESAKPSETSFWSTITYGI